MTADRNPERNELILELLQSQKLSYAVIADTIGVSRMVVAGVAFRNRHPVSTRKASPNSRTGNKIGHGYQPKSYEPLLTAQNTRA